MSDIPCEITSTGYSQQVPEARWISEPCVHGISNHFEEAQVALQCSGVNAHVNPDARDAGDKNDADAVSFEGNEEIPDFDALPGPCILEEQPMSGQSALGLMDARGRVHTFTHQDRLAVDSPKQSATATHEYMKPFAMVEYLDPDVASIQSPYTLAIRDPDSALHGQPLSASIATPLNARTRTFSPPKDVGAFSLDAEVEAKPSKLDNLESEEEEESKGDESKEDESPESGAAQVDEIKHSINSKKRARDKVHGRGARNAQAKKKTERPPSPKKVYLSRSRASDYDTDPLESLRRRDGVYITRRGRISLPPKRLIVRSVVGKKVKKVGIEESDEEQQDEISTEHKKKGGLKEAPNYLSKRICFLVDDIDEAAEDSDESYNEELDVESESDDENINSSDEEQMIEFALNCGETRSEDSSMVSPSPPASERREKIPLPEETDVFADMQDMLNTETDEAAERREAEREADLIYFERRNIRVLEDGGDEEGNPRDEGESDMDGEDEETEESGHRSKKRRLTEHSESARPRGKASAPTRSKGHLNPETRDDLGSTRRGKRKTHDDSQRDSKRRGVKEMARIHKKPSQKARFNEAKKKAKSNSTKRPSKRMNQGKAKFSTHHSNLDDSDERDQWNSHPRFPEDELEIPSSSSASASDHDAHMVESGRSRKTHSKKSITSDDDEDEAEIQSEED